MNLETQSFFRMLSDDTRLSVLMLLQREGELCVCELTHPLDLSQPKISRHLAQLRESDIVQARRAGQWIYCRDINSRSLPMNTMASVVPVPNHQKPAWLAEREAGDSIVLEEPEFCVRAVTLDHGTPVLAFAFEQARTLNIRKDRLVALELPAGTWLGELKRHIATNNLDAHIILPDGCSEQASALADELVLIAPGKKLVYATDLADTPENRQHLTRLARDAHTFFCEAVFVEADRQQAVNTGHLTARACGEIGTATGVERLVPFHFSRRYEDDPLQVYDEVRAACPRAIVPRLNYRD